MPTAGDAADAGPVEYLCRNGDGFMGFEEEFKRANQRTRELKANVPRAVTARYDRRTDAW